MKQGGLRNFCPGRGPQTSPPQANYQDEVGPPDSSWLLCGRSDSVSSAILCPQRQREQAAERALQASEQRCADIAADMALARDVKGELCMEKRRAQEEKLYAQEERTKQLQLHRQRQAVIAAANAYANLQLQRSEELECSKRLLQVAVQQKQQVLTRLQHNRRTAVLAGEVELHRAIHQEVRNLREAVEEAEHREQQQQRLDHLQQARQLAEACLMKELQQQIRDKNAAAEREKQAEEEYLEILSAVQQLECNLEQLTSAARRRRQLQQRDEAAKLLQVRRLQQRSKQLQQQQEDHTLQQYHSLRSALSLAEEQSLLLQCAPHLLPHFTPALLQRLKNIGSAT